MIMAGEEYRKDVPFKNVYFTGIVRDKLGRKMSKQLGNSPDPIELIEKYGADGVRMGMLLTAPAGNDLPFDESICEQGRNFANKIWNALRLVKGWTVSDELNQSVENEVSVQWMEQRMACVLEQIDYKLVWDDFCSWYLEMVKPAYGTPIDRETYNATITIFERLMCMLHPFMPFITEEIWHLLQNTDTKVKEELVAGSSIMIQHMPVSVFFDQRMLDDCTLARDIIAGVRNVRNSKGLSPREELDLVIVSGEGKRLNERFEGIVRKLGNVKQISYGEKPEDAVSFMIGTMECYVPLKLAVDVEGERKKLEEELKYAEGFLASVMKKLGNEKFVNGAPEKVVAVERQKKADAEQKIASLRAQLEKLGKC